MMGMQTEPAPLFYEFRLDDHVPTDHLLRRIDRFLDLESVRSELKARTRVSQDTRASGL
jgi:hypothetical protein